ncbi:MAG: DUF2141 domain-containing protein [Cyanobacteria bacterium J06560_2]
MCLANSFRLSGVSAAFLPMLALFVPLVSGLVSGQSAIAQRTDQFSAQFSAQLSDRLSAQLSIDDVSLTVELVQLRNSEGQVCVSLFDSSKGFPNDETDIVAKQCTEAEATSERDAEDTVAETLLPVVFENLSPGTYAVSVMHDENQDGQLNQGVFGIPTEGFGFSRNPEIRMGAPEFYEAALSVFGDSQITVEMVYF